MKYLKQGSLAELENDVFRAKGVLYANDLPKVLWCELPEAGTDFKIKYNTETGKITASEKYYPNFVFLGYSGYFALSPDGYNWKTMPKFTNYTIKSLIYIDELGLLVAVASSAGVFISNDGLNWENTLKTDIAFLDVIWDGEKIIVVGKSSERGNSTKAQSFISYDGINWVEGTAITSSAANINGICKFKNLYYATGLGTTTGGSTIYKSTDALNWEPITTIPNIGFKDISCNDNIIAAAGEGCLYTSIDGVTWTKQSLILGGLQVNRVKNINNDIYLIGTRRGSFNILLYKTSDGINWTDLASGSASGYDLCTNGKTWVLVNSYGYVATDDEQSWPTRYEKLYQGNSIVWFPGN